MISLRKLVMIFSCVLLAQWVNAQQLREAGNSRNAKQEEYEFIAGKEGVYTIKVVNPQGEIASMPVKQKKLTEGEQIKFKLDQSKWQRGQYHIIANCREGEMVSLPLVIEKPPIKKPNEGNY